METWSFVFVCSVYFNILVNLVSGITIHNCIGGWIDIPDDTSTFITCTNISKIENVTWRVENDIRNETILDIVCGSVTVCDISIINISSQSNSNYGASLVIDRNHRRYGGFTVTCFTTTEHAQCRMHVFHAAELNQCKTEINTRSWTVTATCHINKFFSSREKARCEGRVDSFMLEKSLKNYTRFCSLENYTDPRYNNTYQKGNCSLTTDLPILAGDYSYIILIVPGKTQETVGKVLIDKSETNCTAFSQENPSGSCECFKRDPGSFPTTPHSHTWANTSYVCNLVMGSTSHSGQPPHDTTSQPHPDDSRDTDGNGGCNNCVEDLKENPDYLATDCPRIVREGSDLKCNCFTSHHTDPTATISWNVPGGGSLLNVNNVDRQDNDNKYTCHLVWGTPPSRKSVTYTLQVSYGPQSVRISTNAIEPLVTNGTAQMPLFCQADDFYPAVNYTWTGVTCINKNLERGTCLFTPRVPQDDGHQVSCTAHNVFSFEQLTSNSYTIKLNYPPPSSPNITGYKKGSILTEEKNIRLKCEVKGGKPKVSLVIFLCGDEPDQQDIVDNMFVSSSVVISLKAKHNNTVCQCKATWNPQPAFYSYTTSVRIYVSERKKSRTPSKETKEMRTEQPAPSRQTPTKTSQGTNATSFPSLKGLGSSPSDQMKSSPSPQSKPGHLVTTGVIAGIVAAVVVTVIVITAIVYVTRRQRNRSTTCNTCFKDNTQHDGQYAAL